MNFNFYKLSGYSEFIDKVLKFWDTSLESLSLSDRFTVEVGFRSFFKRVSGHLVPMGEDTLWESSSGSGLSKSGSETERFTDWKMGLHLDEWGSVNWLFTNNNSSSLSKSLIDLTNGIIWGLDLD